MARILVILILLLCLVSCKNTAVKNGEWRAELCKGTQGALIGTRFQSYEALKQCLDIEYLSGTTVKIMHHSNGQAITSILRDGVTEKDLERVQDSGLVDKLGIVMRSPYLIFCREDLQRVRLLARRNGSQFGEGDQTFFHLAQAMTHHVIRYSMDSVYIDDFSEKGLLNTFNHLTAQAFITTLFSEKTADYVADLHEIARLPELTSGEFSAVQLADLHNGPVDNYVDLINNEWGQELGKKLKTKYDINRKTIWSPSLLTKYLNDVQSYNAWSMKVFFAPFSGEEEIIIKFTRKLNYVMGK